METTIGPKAKRDYSARRRNLEHIGFLSYREYLSSDLWKSIRLRVLERDSYTCRSCKRARATQVHHASYGVNVLLGKRLGRLFSVCSDCHKAGEFAESEKVAVRQANVRMRLAKPPKKKKKRKTRVRRGSNPDWDWYVRLEIEAARSSSRDTAPKSP